MTGSTFAHKAAQGGDLATLQREVAKKKEVIHAKDSNGWTVRVERRLAADLHWWKPHIRLKLSVAIP